MILQLPKQIAAAWQKKKLGDRFMKDPSYILKTLPETKRAEFELCKKQVAEKARKGGLLFGGKMGSFCKQGPVQRLAVMAYIHNLNELGHFKGDGIFHCATSILKIISDMMQITDRFLAQPPDNIDVCLSHAESLWGRALFDATGAGRHYGIKIEPLTPQQVFQICKSVKELEQK